MKPAVLVCAMLLAVSSALAQAGHGRGRLTGRVLDDKGLPIKDAKITLLFLKHEEMRGREFVASKFTINESVRLEVLSDKKGRWYCNGLAGGTWEIRVSHDGFVPEIHTIRIYELSSNPVIRSQMERTREGYYSEAPEVLETANEYYRVGDYRNALALYNNYVEEFPGAVGVSLVIGDCCRQIGDIGKAIKTFKSIIEKIGDDPALVETLARAFAGIAECYINEGDNEGAKKYLELSIRTSPNDDLVAASLGELLFSSGQTEEAIESYLIAIKIAPDRAIHRYRIGLLYLNIGKVDSAKANFKKVLELEPDSELASQAATILKDLGKRL